jgi:FixJ family two-component response regulator
MGVELNEAAEIRLTPTRAPEDRGTAIPAEPVVFVVDDDLAACSTIRTVAGILNLRCEVFASGSDFLSRFDRCQSGCLITELKIPGIGGLQIQQRLAAERATIPIIFVSADASLPIAVRALRAGAFHFLLKPLHEQELWDAIQDAMAMDQEHRAAARCAEELAVRLATLTAKEELILQMIAGGNSNREMAKQLDVSVRTIEVRRAALMKKLALRSPEEMLRFALMACSHHANGSFNGNGRSLYYPFNGSAPGSSENRSPARAK